LRTPLASIGGAASALLVNPAMDEKRRTELAATISEETQRLERILRNVLDVTRLESGTMKLQADWHSVEELIGSALARVDPLLRERRVELQLPGDLPLVKVDGLLFEQMMVNLLENAAKHTPAGTPVAVEASQRDGMLLISVADRGAGIPAGEEDRIFEKLYRSSSEGAQGFGLGLAICRAVATAHGGTIDAAHRPGGGAVFCLRLPLEESPPEVPNG
jgi:two-component system sensor histidine kinase KdpD